MDFLKNIWNKVTGNTQQQQANALQSSLPNMTYLPNISTPQGIGQTQQNGSITLLNQQGRPTGSVINQQGVGSTPMPTSTSSPYYTPPKPSGTNSTPIPSTPAPISSYSTPNSSGTTYLPPLQNANSTPAVQKSTPQTAPSAAYSALRNAVSSVKNAFTTPINPNANASQSANALSAIGGQSSIPSGSATPTLQQGVQTTATVNPAQATSGVGDIKTQYQTITQDKNSDSTTLRNNISQTKALEDSQKQTQIESIKAKIAEITAQRDQMIAAGEQVPLDRTQLDTLGVDTPYTPDSQPAISQVSAQLDALEKELASVMQDSPEYQAANEALNAKIAEEASIKARLNEGQTNIAEQPIAYSFIGGQQEALQRRANADLQTNYAGQIPLQQRLATEQAKKQSAIDVVKTKYGNLGDERDRLLDTYKMNYERKNTLADAERTQQYKLQEIASKPKTTKTSNYGSGATSADVTTIKNALSQSKYQGSEADGKYADPTLYLQNYQNWIASGGTAEEFFKEFPPKTYVNPANTWLPAEIMQFVQGESRSV